jgi:hypothetical protein
VVGAVIAVVGVLASTPLANAVLLQKVMTSVPSASTSLTVVVPP